MLHALKLGWNMIFNQEALWVTDVLRAKYNCGGLMLPTIRRGTPASHLLRGIANSWHLVEHNISWVLRNGHSVRFWQDPWVPGFGPLSEHVDDIPDRERNFMVSSYVSDNGWKWDIFPSNLPSHIRNKIASIKPPCSSFEDFPVWNYSKDEYFSIKTTYQFLYKDIMGQPPSFTFDLVWKWKGPPMIQAFLRKVAYGKLLTNVESVKRGLIDSDICPLCHQSRVPYACDQRL